MRENTDQKKLCIWTHFTQCWDAIKKLTGVRSKLISDMEKYQFNERMIRNGTYMISKFFVESSNKLLKSYNSNKPKSYIIDANNLDVRRYLDANNIYKHSMMQLLLFEILD